MLRKLVLHDVGPASKMAMDPVAPRLNVITGDNGLGKSFLLDAAWWALTRSWHGFPAVPSQPNARIEHHFDAKSTVSKTPSIWNPKAQVWKRKRGRPPNPGLVLYAAVDGSFSVWDPVRNYRLYLRADGGEAESPSAYQFSSSEVLWGLRRQVMAGGIQREETLCLGLIDEWRLWQRSRDPKFEMLKRLLDSLGPDGMRMEPGALFRPSLDDVREIPTLKMPYGQDVPITYAPAGVRRMCKLAYLLTWALSEHQAEAARLGQTPSNQVIMLVDEVETHLHPRWQRTVLPSLMSALEEATPDTRYQFIVATHSPFVLASVEAKFDPKQDALWKLDLVEGDVVIERDAWHKRGDILMWLRSDVFDEVSGYSVEAEAQMRRAAELMGADAPSETEAVAVHKDLRSVLADTDAFWLGWRAWRRSRGWTS